MKKKIDIHKAGGIIIRDRKILVERSKNTNFFKAPGGSIESGETPEQALIRELNEEFGMDLTGSNLEFFGTYYAPAVGQEEKYLRMDVFMINSWYGEVSPDNEVEEYLWIDSLLATDIILGSVFAHEVLPRLKDKGLID